MKVGDRVRYGGDDPEDSFSGIVHHIFGIGPYAIVHVRRDDGEEGSGRDGTWTAHECDLELVAPARVHVNTYWVLKHTTTGEDLYVASAGSPLMYTSERGNAMRFEGASDAKFNQCSDDRVVKVAVYRRTK